MTKYKNNTLLKIHSTTNPDLDGLFVRVVGVAYDVGPVGETIYIVMHLTGLFRNGYEGIALTESCLAPVFETA